MGKKEVEVGHDGFQERVKKYPFRYRSAAENVAMCQGYSNPSKFAVNGWIDSPGHRKNLLSNHDYCAIAVYKTNSGAYYFTQLFALLY